MSHWRRPYRGRDFRRALTIEELRRTARRRVPNFAFEYLEGGAEDEITLARNRTVFGEYRFVPRALVDTAGRRITSDIFGRPSASPLVIAPTGLNGLQYPNGDLALARAAAKAGIPFTLSTVSNADLDDVAAQAGGRLWMQLYVFKDRSIARDLVSRAAAAGYEALVLTVDAQVFGSREWDQRNFRRPGLLNLRNRLDALLHPRWLYRVMWPGGFPKFTNIWRYLPAEYRTTKGGVAYTPRLFAQDLDWRDVEWLRAAWPGALLIKGLLDPEDVCRARDAGCDGAILSNHGGRQLDHCVAPLEMLAAARSAVGPDFTLLADSGFRRGGDVLKALLLGADAVMIGRAVLYGLAAGGEAGAAHALGILNGEIDRVLGQLGCQTLADLSPAMIRRTIGLTPWFEAADFG